ncbi:hypothetical protein CVS30_16160, partial [Arthrobacter psychrolactophilus]
ATGQPIAATGQNKLQPPVSLKLQLTVIRRLVPRYEEPAQDHGDPHLSSETATRSSCFDPLARYGMKPKKIRDYPTELKNMLAVALRTSSPMSFSLAISQNIWP